MTCAYNVVDADGHILEPLDLWDRYMDPAFHDRAPRIVKDNETGKERLIIEEQNTSDARLSIGRVGAVGARQGIVEPDAMAYKDGKPGGFDPHARIPDMDADGIDAAFLYPSIGLFSGAIHDPQLAAAVCRAYNRWLADYCKPVPRPAVRCGYAADAGSVDLAVAEMRFVRKELGFKAAFIRPNPYHGNKTINDPMYEPFWAAAEDLDLSIGFHEGASAPMPRAAAPVSTHQRTHIWSSSVNNSEVALARSRPAWTPARRSGGWSAARPRRGRRRRRRRRPTLPARACGARSARPMRGRAGHRRAARCSAPAAAFEVGLDEIRRARGSRRPTGPRRCRPAYAGRRRRIGSDDWTRSVVRKPSSAQQLRVVAGEPRLVGRHVDDDALARPAGLRDEPARAARGRARSSRLPGAGLAVYGQYGA